ncbi:MAG TPA: putative Ig domain-containing protein [Bryobacteraceae bacterium]|nr:putative Ig domain-containing protein [Bryobacteraceae bacterium]
MPTEIQVSSDSGDVLVPATVTTRANQSSLTFQAAIQRTAKQQTVVVTAGAGDDAVADTIVVLPASGPVLTAPRRQLAKFKEPLQFAVSATDAGDLPIQLAAAGMPAGASFDTATGNFAWTPDPSQGGKYEITFTAANSAGQSSKAVVTIEVDAGIPVLDSTAPLCSPNAIASLTGRWLAAPGQELADPSGSAFDLGGTKVTVNGQHVPVLFASATRVSFLCPALDPGIGLSIAVETGSAATGAVTGTMSSVSPAILSLDGSGQSQGVVTFAENSDLVMSRNYQSPAEPAQPGDAIVIWATGLGSAPELSTGTLAVTIGGVYTAVESVSTMPGYAGIVAVEVRVPTGAPIGDAVKVQLAIAIAGNQASSNVATVAIEPASR